MRQWSIATIVWRQDGASPFFVAAQNGHVDTCQVLLDHRASVDLPRNVSGCSLLGCYVTKIAEVIPTLIGAQCSAVTSCTSTV